MNNNNYLAILYVYYKAEQITLKLDCTCVKNKIY